MTDGYDCYQNAMAERINGILKNEFLLSRPADLAQAREMVKESVAIYNHERPHLALRIPLYSITDWHRSPISDSHPFDQPGT